MATLLSLQACATRDCVFDKDFFSAQRYEKHDSVAKVVFDTDRNAASIITRDGDVISIKHWSCHHNGLHAVMLTGPQAAIPELNIGGKILGLAAIVLDDIELSRVKTALTGRKLSLEENAVVIRVDDDSYAEFYIRYAVVNESLVIEIRYYQN